MPSAVSVIYGAVVLTGIGMMLVVAGAVATGFFLPGVVLIAAGMAAFAAGALLAAFAPRAPETPADR
jgi:hypothetical protein